MVIKIGPDSVGYLLTEKAKVFGGDILTTTDIAVAKYNLDIGDPGLLKGLENETIDIIQKNK